MMQGTFNGNCTGIALGGGHKVLGWVGGQGKIS